MNAGWQRKRVADLAQHSLGKMLDKAKNRGEPRPYLRNLNVRWFDFDLTDVLEMRFLPSEVERYTVRKGDVVVCEGGYPGRAAIWERDEPIFFQKALHRVRFHQPLPNSEGSPTRSSSFAGSATCSPVSTSASSPPSTS